MVPTGEFLTVIRFLLIITLGKQTHTKTFSDKSESMVTLYGRKVGVSGGSVVKKKKSACQPRRLGSNFWVGKIPGGGHGNPLPYSCLENPMDRGAWRATVYRVPKSWTRLKQLGT